MHVLEKLYSQLTFLKIPIPNIYRYFYAEVS